MGDEHARNAKKLAEQRKAAAAERRQRSRGRKAGRRAKRAAEDELLHEAAMRHLRLRLLGFIK
jgi:hypothetical protein